MFHWDDGFWAAMFSTGHMGHGPQLLRAFARFPAATLGPQCRMHAHVSLATAAHKKAAKLTRTALKARSKHKPKARLPVQVVDGHVGERAVLAIDAPHHLMHHAAGGTGKAGHCGEQ